MTKTLVLISSVFFCLLCISPASAAIVDFNNLTAYKGQPTNSDASLTVTDGGLTGTFTNNKWMAYSTPITVTPTTTLSFDYKSSSQPEIAGFGFDTDNNFNFDDNENAFKVWGIQSSWDINNLKQYDSSGDYASYSINLSDYFTVGSTFNYLYFFNDDDTAQGGDGLSESTFRNVTLSATPLPGAVFLLGSGLIGLIGIRRKNRS